MLTIRALAFMLAAMLLLFSIDALPQVPQARKKDATATVGRYHLAKLSPLVEETLGKRWQTARCGEYFLLVFKPEGQYLAFQPEPLKTGHGPLLRYVHRVNVIPFLEPKHATPYASEVIERDGSILGMRVLVSEETLHDSCLRGPSL